MYVCMCVVGPIYVGVCMLSEEDLRWPCPFCRETEGVGGGGVFYCNLGAVGV